MSRTGDQDWFNMLSWSHPGLVYILPCVYNWQTSVQVTQCEKSPIFCKSSSLMASGYIFVELTEAPTLYKLKHLKSMMYVHERHS